MIYQLRPIMNSVSENETVVVLGSLRDGAEFERWSFLPETHQTNRSGGLDVCFACTTLPFSGDVKQQPEGP